MITARANKYARFFTNEFLMGPNSIVLLDELLEKCTLRMNRSQTLLDLGCGKGITNLFLANETGSTVCANDLWISAEENMRRFKSWGAAACLLSRQEDATALSFRKENFDGIVSIDAYHYFAGQEGFFQEKILPYVKRGGCVLIVIPGIKSAYEGRQEALLSEWLGEEAHLFKITERWRALIGESAAIRSVDIWELERFDEAWSTWLQLGNDYALGDKAKFESIIKPYTCFVGIQVQKR